MTASDYRKILKVIKAKPGKIQKYNKYNVPKIRNCGVARNKCSVCLKTGSHVGKYGLSLCRYCFRDYAKKLGFKKFD
jgi:ribosomal protein S14